jgi:hypothetical protein
MKRIISGLLLLAACGGSGGSPEAVFGAAKKAAQSKDYRGLFNCMDPDKSDQLVLGSVMIVGFATMNNKSAEAEVEAVMKKHNVAKDGGEAAIKNVKDKPGLFADLMSIVEKHSKESAANMKVDGDLKDVKIDGDTAKGDLVKSDGSKTPMTFVRKNGRWYLSPGMK